MVNANLIKEHMEVVGADGEHVGTVDSIDHNQIKLTKTDSTDQHHHYISVSLVDSVDIDQVHLTVNAEDAIRH